MPSFRIQETEFNTSLTVGSEALTVESSPRRYTVEFISHLPLAATIEAAIEREIHPIILADRRVLDMYLPGSRAIAAAPSLIADVSEDFKTLDGVMQLTELLQSCGATRSSMLFVIGGGIIQDVGAFAGAMYKRGIPWTFIPTTLLSQGDSCVGGKTGINYHNTKNLLGLFSAPRRILIHTGFLHTLPEEEILSGLGETFRLTVTGGIEFVDNFERLLPSAVSGDTAAMTKLIESSLSVKRAVVERDEFELDLRRSMNLGHSIGHAFEAITNHGIPHGIGVSVGILVESEISFRRGLISGQEKARLVRIGAKLIPERVRGVLRNLNLDDILEVLKRDKKSEGSNLKLVVIEHIGQIRFIDLALEAESIELIRRSVLDVLEALDAESSITA